MKNHTQKCENCGGTGKQFDDAKQGEQLKHEREKAGMSQCKIASRMGHSGAYICQLESGIRRLTAALVASYRAALKISNKQPKP